MVAEINDDRVLKFLQKRFQAKDVSANEAVQTLLIAMNHLQPRAELVEKAKVSQQTWMVIPCNKQKTTTKWHDDLSQEIMNMEFIKSNPHMWPAAVFCFGSLVYKHCAYHSPCPQAAVQVYTGVCYVMRNYLCNRVLRFWDNYLRNISNLTRKNHFELNIEIILLQVLFSPKLTIKLENIGDYSQDRPCVKWYSKSTSIFEKKAKHVFIVLTSHCSTLPMRAWETAMKLRWSPLWELWAMQVIQAALKPSPTSSLESLPTP